MAKTKEQRRKYNRTYYEKHKGEVLERSYSWKRLHLKRFQQLQENWRQRNKYKTNPEHLAQSCILLKDYCEICGSTEKLQRHHWNYNKPKMVNTLCGYCHRVQHYKNINNIPLSEEVKICPR